MGNKEEIALAKIKKELEIFKDDVQEFADFLDVSVTVTFHTDDQFEELVFTPRQWAKNKTKE